MLFYPRPPKKYFKQLALKPYHSHINDSDYLNYIQQLNGRIILHQHFHQSSLLLKSQNKNKYLDKLYLLKCTIANRILIKILRN